MSTCVECGAPARRKCATPSCTLFNQPVGRSGVDTPSSALANNSNSRNDYVDVGSPGDIKDIIFKRYTMTEKKRFKQYAGFDLYAQKNKGENQAWEIVKQFNEIEGKNSLLSFLFGHEQQGNVFYLNTSAMALSFDYNLAVQDRQYKISISLSLQIETPALFLNQYQGHQVLRLDDLSSLLDDALKQQLLIELQGLDQNTTKSINFKQFDSDLNKVASDVLASKSLEVSDLTCTGEQLIDEEKVALNNSIKQINNAEDLTTHQMSSSSNVALHQKEISTNEAVADIKSEITIDDAKAAKNANAQVNYKDSKIQIVKDDSDIEIEKIKGQIKIADVQGELSERINQTEINGLKQGKTKAEIEVEIDAIKANAARGHREKDAELETKIHTGRLVGLIEVDHQDELNSLELEKKRKAPEAPAVSQAMQSNKEANTQDDNSVYELPAKHFLRCEHVINVLEQEAAVANTPDFGSYYWDLVVANAPALKDLLTNARLHYIRYEDNYCSDLASISNIYQVFKGIRQFPCYREFSESHIVLGPGGNITSQNGLNLSFKASSRNRLMQRLFKDHEHHCSVSQKSKIHDRDMCLVFTNGAHIRMKLTYGMSFWQFKPAELPQTLQDKLQKLLEYNDIDRDLTDSLKALNMPLFCKATEKDTTIPLWGWLPADGV